MITRPEETGIVPGNCRVPLGNQVSGRPSPFTDRASWTHVDGVGDVLAHAFVKILRDVFLC
jgi:hypothetical protein